MSFGEKAKVGLRKRESFRRKARVLMMENPALRSEGRAERER